MNKNCRQLVSQIDRTQPKCFYVLDPMTSGCKRILFKDYLVEQNKTIQKSMNNRTIDLTYVQNDNDALPEMNFAPFDISELFGN